MVIFGQVIGFIFLILFIASFQFKEKKRLIQVRISSKVFASIHYFLIGAKVGCISQFIGIFLDYFCYKFENNKSAKKSIIVVFVLLYAIASWSAYKNIYDCLPVLGSILTMIALFQKGTRYVRVSQFIISPMFLMYNIINHSYAGMITEVLVLVSCLIGIRRLDSNKSNDD